MLLKDAILVQLYVESKKDKPDPQEVYSLYAGPRIDDFIKAMVQLEKEGSVFVPPRAWSEGGDNDLPEDIVMTGVRLTEYGKQKAQQYEQHFRERRK